MKSVFRMSFVFLVAISPLSVVASDGVKGKIGVGFDVGAQRYIGDVKGKGVGLGANVLFRIGVTSNFALMFRSGYGELNDGSTHRTFKSLILPAELVGVISFAPSSKVNPYIFFGGGVFNFSSKDRRNRWLRKWDGSPVKGWERSVLSGFGFEYFLNDQWSLTFSGDYHQTFGDDIDGVKEGENDGYFNGRIGLIYYFGGKKDSDHDLIEDKRDADPFHPEDYDGYEDEDGAPDLDNDQDGIPDVRDKNPNKPEDFDGFQDEDGAPDVDNDNDGILDKNDLAPNKPEDFDGFQDNDGVPDLDNDGDGIPDEVDKCPNAAETFNGYEDNDGCPDMLPKMVLRGVTFKPGSAALTQESYKILDEVYQTLRDNPEIKVEIRGYTDNRGPQGSNLKLSRKRAKAVKQYLVNHGIDPHRLRAIGYGEKDPIATNETPEGRAANRRIEFVRIE